MTRMSHLPASTLETLGSSDVQTSFTNRQMVSIGAIRVKLNFQPNLVIDIFRGVEQLNLRLTAMQAHKLCNECV
jgi:hypothetical protein